MNLGGRLLRGLVLALVFGVLGWIASRLTVDMVLSRHFDSSRKQQIEQALPFFWFATGFLTGIGIDRRVLSNDYLRPVCWGAVASLTLVMLCVRIPLWIDPGWKNKLPPIAAFSIGLDWETVGLISSPAALLIGGFLGGVYHWYFGRRCAAPVEESGIP